MKFFRLKIRVSICLSAIFCFFVGFGYAENLYQDSTEVFNLMKLNGKNGFFINGVKGYNSGSPVSGVGDVNGDGIADFLIGAQSDNNKNLFQIYVLFGRKDGWPLLFNITELNGNNGFVINGTVNSMRISSGRAGDVNGDGVDDILIGAPMANNFTGQSYLVFGSKEKWPIVMQLSSLNGTNGFVIDGNHLIDECGLSVSGVGDMNGDGLDDIIIGAPGAFNGKGQSYLIFGRKGEWPARINVSALDGKNGFTLEGITAHELSGWSVGGDADINGDGLSDFIIGAPGGNADSIGKSYVILGSKLAWPALFRLVDVNGLNGFVVKGINTYDFSGYCVSGTGDVNSDGLDDIIIGAPGINHLMGQSYVIFGKKGSWAAVLNASSLAGNDGFIMTGIAADRSGAFVSGGGDVNGDGIDDLIIGAPAVNNNTGEGYVIFGTNSWPAIIHFATLGGSGLVINGSLNNGGYSIIGAGDVNGDGLGDVLIGSMDNSVGQSYVAFGYHGKTSVPIFIIIQEISVASMGIAAFASIGTFLYYGHQYLEVFEEFKKTIIEQEM